jgi:hypothetical protein
MYYIHRILETGIFGDNMLAWSLYTGLLGVITISFFYLGARNLNFSITHSLCLILLAFVGPQMAVWWRLGPAETGGMAFLAISFFFLSRCKKNHTANTALFSVFLILASLCKESFTIIIPAFIFYKIWREKNTFKITLKKAVIKNLILLLPASAMLANIIFTIMLVDTTKLGYAGIDSNIISTIIGLLGVIKNFAGGYAIITIFFLAAIYYRLKAAKSFIAFLKPITIPLIFSLLIILPNLVLYAKSGMFERYLFPATIGAAFIITVIIKESNDKNLHLNKIFTGTILLFALFFSFFSIKNATAFALEGKYTNELLSSITTGPSKKNVLLAANPADSYEWSFSLNNYLSIEKNIPLTVYAMEGKISWQQDKNFISKLTNNWHAKFIKQEITQIKEKPNILIFLNKELSPDFFKQNKQLKTGYANTLSKDSPFALYQQII